MGFKPRERKGPRKGRHKIHDPLKRKVKGKRLTPEELSEIYERYQELLRTLGSDNAAIKKLQEERHMGKVRLQNIISIIRLRREG